MLCSMTGYGEGEYADAQGYWKVEIRSYNHRYLDIQIRMPRELSLFGGSVAPKNPVLPFPGQGRTCCLQGGNSVVENEGLP